MKNILLLSSFLFVGLVGSQVIPLLTTPENYVSLEHILRLLTAVALGFVMIRVGYGFDLDKNRLRDYGWDYIVAMTSATFPWLFVTFYFVFVLTDTGTFHSWKESLIAARFAAPTSAGILFAMLTASGLAATWVYRKIRVLAIFDDLDTILLMVVLQILLVGWKWQLLITVTLMFLLLWAAWRYLHYLRIPITWPWVVGYSVVATSITESIYHWSKLIDKFEPIHIEILLPAFVLGYMIANKSQLAEGNTGFQIDILERSREKRATFIISLVFMVLVGLSMPSLNHVAGPAVEAGQVTPDIVMITNDLDQLDLIHGEVDEQVYSSISTGSLMSPWWITIHVIVVTFIANLGKIFPLFCYRKEAHWKERLALSIGMFPRGEVGAGVLVISISYGIGGAVIVIAMLSLTLNLFLTGMYIIMVKKLLKNYELSKQGQTGVLMQ